MSDTGALSQRGQGEDVAFGRTTTEGMDRASHGELLRDLPRHPRGASVNVLKGDTEVVA